MFTKIHCKNKHGWTSRVISSVSEVYMCVYMCLYIYIDIPVGKILCNLSKTIASIAQFRSRSQSRSIDRHRGGDTTNAHINYFVDRHAIRFLFL